jgi:hypothetical protein
MHRQLIDGNPSSSCREKILKKLAVEPTMPRSVSELLEHAECAPFLKCIQTRSVGSDLYDFDSMHTRLVSCLTASSDEPCFLRAAALRHQLASSQAPALPAEFLEPI